MQGPVGGRPLRFEEDSLCTNNLHRAVGSGPVRRVMEEFYVILWVKNAGIGHVPG